MVVMGGDSALEIQGGVKKLFQPQGIGPKDSSDVPGQRNTAQTQTKGDWHSSVHSSLFERVLDPGHVRVLN